MLSFSNDFSEVRLSFTKMWDPYRNYNNNKRVLKNYKSFIAIFVRTIIFCLRFKGD
ncbi:hypothetical protein LMANV2_660015 [Leptospira interrogans serovar Manilae]|uniref:Uncharacterized protein n=1 Tax=Leptospira interrogans serovar Manilae TaxID=214675 RepID=A0AAQ1P2Q4_LEPIR|nr:hypothetical protein LMANV2_660015 [Leptospira interrogans serovar Manilae]